MPQYQTTPSLIGNPSERPTEAEIQAAALQFVRKVSGYRKPARANQAAFDRAVTEVATATLHLWYIRLCLIYLISPYLPYVQTSLLSPLSRSQPFYAR
jgi:hypothetical protein